MEPSCSGSWSVQNRTWESPVWFLISPHLGSLLLHRHNVSTCSIRWSTAYTTLQMTRSPWNEMIFLIQIEFPQALGNVWFPQCLRLKMAIYTARDNHGGEMGHIVPVLQSSLSPRVGWSSFLPWSISWMRTVIPRPARWERKVYIFCFYSTQMIKIYLMD